MPKSGELIYLDSSAIVKLVVEEPESLALHAFLAGRASVSCALARTEVVLAVQEQGASAIDQARVVLSVLYLRRLDDEVLDAAADLRLPPAKLLRSLDAIHVAAALSFRPRVSFFVTYDRCMEAAASALGLPVVSPS